MKATLRVELHVVDNHSDGVEVDREELAEQIEMILLDNAQLRITPIGSDEDTTVRLCSIEVYRED